MKLSISTGTLFTFPLPTAMAMAKEAGFTGVELIINQEFQRTSSRGLIQHLQQILPINSIHAPFMPLDGWGSPVDSLKRSVELAHEADIPIVNFHPPSWLGFEIGFLRWLYHIHDFQKEVGTDRVRVAMENMPWTGKFRINQYILSATDSMVEFLNERNLYMTFDSTHMGSGHTNFINDFYDCYNSKRVINIHFSDYGHGKEHLLPGHGILPLSRFLNHLAHTDYDQTLTLELSPHEFPRDPAIIVRSLVEIREYLEKETRREDTGKS
jgi:sugar phosphate isomerase/epimerase